MNVYFILCQSPQKQIKVGVSNKPQKRLSDLQTSNPYRLKLLHFVTCGSERHAYYVEKRIHQIFKKYRKSGEWFIDLPLERAIAFAEKQAKKHAKFKDEIVPESLDNELLNAGRGIYF